MTKPTRKDLERRIQELEAEAAFAAKTVAMYHALTSVLPDVLIGNTESGEYVLVVTGDDGSLIRPAEELVGRRLHEVFPKEEADFFLGQIQQTLLEGKIRVFENSLEVKAGPLHFETRMVPVPTAPGEERMVVGLTRDITTRRHLEEQIRIFSAAVEGSPEYFILADPRGNITYTNESARAAFGYSIEEFLGLNIARLDANPSVANKIMLGVIERGQWKGEVSTTRKDGKKRPCLLSVFVIKDSEGGIQGMMGILDDITERKKLEAKLKKLAITDKLTGLGNYRRFAKQLKDEINRASRYNEPLSLLMIDIDRFKGYNDMHGHSEGNRVLKSLGAFLRRESRATDIGCRYGGEEMALILPETPLEGAVLIAERIRARVEQQEYTVEGSVGRVTVSIGVAQYLQGEKGAQLEKRADSNLYAAKDAGRNRVVSG